MSGRLSAHSSDGGRNLLYGFSICRASEPLAANFRDFPAAVVSLATTDRQPVAQHQNLAGDERQSFIKLLAPDATMALDGLTEDELRFWRSVHMDATGFYLLRIRRRERILCQDSIVQESPPGTFFCSVPHSSYTLGSKLSVAGAGPSLLSNFKVGKSWGLTMDDNQTAGAEQFFQSYADATEIATLAAAFAPPAGSRCYVSFDASGWLAKPAPGRFTYQYVDGSEGLYRATVGFVGA